MIGEYEGSGYKEDPYIARRSDGQMVQLSELLYLVAENCDGQRSYGQIAEQVSGSFGKDVSADNVQYLVDKKLRPLGVVTQADGSSPQPPKQDALLALKFKKTLLPEKGVNVVGAALRPLFWPVVILPILAAVIAVDVWYFSTHGIGQSMRDLLYDPLMILAVYALLIVSIGWHEFGHATACRYGGAKPGVIGFGIYVVWPAFYCDVTDTYRLGKGGRVRTDLGGIYFNLIFSLATAGVYFLTRYEPLLVLILIQHLLIVYNFIPFLRMDGYYVVSDLTGVPDLFGRVKPTIKSLVPGQEPEEEVVELKRWVRVVVTLWVLTVIPLLLYLFVMMVISAPRIVATGFDSFLVQSDKLGTASSDGDWAQAAVSLFRILFLVLPMAAMTLTIFRVFKRVAVGAWEMTDERPVLRGLTGITVAACIGFAALILWPNGEYRPIQEGERWTLTDSFQAVRDTGTLRPSLTENQQESYEGAPGVYESTSEESSTEGSSDTTTDGSNEGPTSEGSEEEPATEPTPEATPEPAEPTPTPTPGG